MTALTPDQVQPGDVVLDGTGGCWLRGDSAHSWSTFAGPVMYFGPWLEEYGPQGELVLLARGGQPAS